MLSRPAHDGACAMDQLAPEIVVGAASDAAEPWLAASCILPGHQPDPGCHLAARAKLTAIVDAADDRSGNDRPHPRQLCEPPTSLVRAAEGDDHCVELLDPAIQVVQLVHELDAMIVTLCRTNETCRRLAKLPGVGPIVATAIIGAVNDGRQFRSGREMAA